MAEAEAREERLARNEVVFRLLNEQIDAIAIDLGGSSPYEFICECATRGCFDRLELTLDEYERVRGDGSRFVVRAGHEDIEVEQVVEVHPAYLVVEKDGTAGLVASDENPRA
jgi:hypothetical protein